MTQMHSLNSFTFTCTQFVQNRVSDKKMNFASVWCIFKKEVLSKLSAKITLENCFLNIQNLLVHPTYTIAQVKRKIGLKSLFTSNERYAGC